MNVQETVFADLRKLTKKEFHLDSLLSDLKLDSLDIAELIIEAEKKFKIEISDEMLQNLKKVSDIVNLITDLVEAE